MIPASDLSFKQLSESSTGTMQMDFYCAHWEIQLTSDLVIFKVIVMTKLDDSFIIFRQLFDRLFYQLRTFGSKKDIVRYPGGILEFKISSFVIPLFITTSRCV